jgi:SSS family solute:Na+ symporter
MIVWLAVFAAFWLGALVFFSTHSFKRNKGDQDYLFAGSGLGTMIGLLTFAATLFSTFTFMGMPDFFRNHGVGAWIFLGVSDAVMFFFILWFGHRLRARGAAHGFQGMARLVADCYGRRWTGYLYLAAVFIFLIPYVSIQVRGISIFLSAVFPDTLPFWGWACLIVITMLLYSEIGGLRAIIYSDSLQALVLLLALWLIALGCLAKAGGLESLFQQVGEIEPGLLSTPGPKGLMSFQFLLSACFAVTMIPATQPQVSTRLMIMRDTRKLHRMAVALGVFAFIILVPTIFIGFYGAIYHHGAPTQEFLSNVLLFEQARPVAALVVIGLLAAAISTADSQIFALGTELRSMLTGGATSSLRITRLAITGFGLCALVFSVLSSDQFALLATLSFQGTSLLGPMILCGIFRREAPHPSIAWVTAVALVIFLGSLVKLGDAPLVPKMIGPVQTSLLMMAVVVGYSLVACKLLFRERAVPTER